MPDKYEQALRVLGLEPGATEAAIKDAYRDLVKVWHPDRFGSDARLRAKAEAKLTEVNAAFETLRGYRPSDYSGPHQSAETTRRPTGFTGSLASENTRAAASKGTTHNVFILSVAAVLLGFLGTGLFMWRSRPYPTPEPVQAPSATRSAGATRLPARPPVETPSPVPATTGSLIVASRPLGARVALDGAVLGHTPITLTDVQPGNHQVDVALDGNEYETWSSSIVVTAGQEQKLLAVMTPLQRSR